MSRRANGHLRCPRCRAHLGLCFCDQIGSIQTRTRLVLVIHRFEARKTTNTGRIAVECLPNSEVWVRGGEDRHDADFELDPERQAVLLYPDEGAVPLVDFVGSSRPLTLVVPDGTWRQARKVRHRMPSLSTIPVVGLPPGPPSCYGLRHESREGGLSTLEAIARALSVLEGEAVGQGLMRVFRLMVERTLWTRGTIGMSQLEGRLPPGTQRHDPKSGLGGTRPP